jgi:hypothetical protein
LYVGSSLDPVYRPEGRGAASVAFWLLCVVLAPLAFGSYPSKYRAMPLCLVTVAGGLHLILFRREYDEILRKAVRLPQGGPPLSFRPATDAGPE